MPGVPFTLDICQALATQGIVTQTSAGLHVTRLCCRLHWPMLAYSCLRGSWYGSVGLVGLSRGSAVLCGFGWGSACLHPLDFVSFIPARPTPGSAVLRVSTLCRMVLRWTSDPIIEPCIIIACSVYHSGSGCPFVVLWASADPTYGCWAAAGPYALPQASAGPHAPPLASAGPPAATSSSAGPRVPFVALEPRPV